jgi:glutathione S-transferase
MKLYMHPFSTTCRAVRLMCAENGVTVDEELVDLMTGAQHQEPFASLNPSRQVPFLTDGDWGISESSAIMKYIADVNNLACYPKDLKKRAKVNEAMDWLNTGLYRDYGYNLIYPQLFPHHKRPSDEAQSATLSWGQKGANRWLQVLNDYWIGPNNKFMTGNEVTIADYFGAAIITVGDMIGCDFAAYPNVERWLSNMRALPHWAEVNAMMEGAAAGNKGKEFVTLA